MVTQLLRLAGDGERICIFMDGQATGPFEWMSDVAQRIAEDSSDEIEFS
jgi:hypothetical protein